MLSFRYNLANKMKLTTHAKDIIRKHLVYDKPIAIEPEKTMVDEFNRGGKEPHFLKPHSIDKSDGLIVHKRKM